MLIILHISEQIVFLELKNKLFSTMFLLAFRCKMQSLYQAFSRRVTNYDVNKHSSFISITNKVKILNFTLVANTRKLSPLSRTVRYCCISWKSAWSVWLLPTEIAVLHKVVRREQRIGYHWTFGTITLRMSMSEFENLTRRCENNFARKQTIFRLAQVQTIRDLLLITI